VEVEMIANPRKASSVVVLALLAACNGRADSGHATSGGDQTASTPPVQDTNAPPEGAPRAPPPSDGTSSPSQEDTGGPAIRLVGRFDQRDAAGPKCGWPGCRIVADFDGTAISVRLDEQERPDGPSEWDVAVDGKWLPKLVLTLGDHTYDLASALPAGKHRVELYKRTESQTGVTQLLGFDFHGGALMAPPPRAGRRIEVVGDSEAAGYGYAGAASGGDCGGTAWLARYQDFRAAWPARLGDKLGAELLGTVFSGKGFYFNAWRPDTETIDVLYPRANPEDPTSVFAYGTLVPDVVLVAIGGNDYNLGRPEDTGPAPLAGFTAKARAFTSLLRDAYPRAHLFLVAYATLSDDDPPGRLKRTSVVTAFQTVTREHNASGDARVYFVAPPIATSSELTACGGHGGPEYHERIATFMAAEVAARTGWK
jgi:lysophospholipase L1-like esterase